MKRVVSIILSILFCLNCFLICLFLNQKKIINYKLDINNNYLIITLNKNDILCQITTNKIDENNWQQANNNKCSYKLEDNNYKLYLKLPNGKIQEIKEMQNIGKIISVKLNVKELYLALDETYKPTLKIESIGNINKDYTWTSNNNKVAIVNENNEIIGKEVGSAIIKTNYNNKDYIINVKVTDKIVKAPTMFDTNKEYLSCNFYSESDNDILDKILKSKIINAGYQTRAGAVEAARFLTLNFPYKINYFYENGRVTTFDKKTLAYGEGRYYHEGLYLHKSRYSNILESVNGPAIWGCNLYSNIKKESVANGLNCSGFIAWVIKNAGYDPGDIGAGITSVFDFTDIGEKKELNSKIIKSNIIRAGELIYSPRVGGHIAMIVGIDEANYYVAEAYWETPRGVVINTYNKEKITEYFTNVILMDEYYKDDGNYTEIWY